MSEQDTFQRALAALQDAALDDSRWPQAAALVDEACRISGHKIVMGQGFGDDATITLSRFFHQGERREDLERVYFGLYHGIDERVPRLRRLPDSKVVHVTDLYTETELKTSLAYNEGLRFTGGQNALNVRLDGPGDSRIVWALSDSVDSNAWSSAQVEMIRRFLPHIRHLVRVRHALTRARVVNDSLMRLLDNDQVGVVYLDRRARILEMNDRALGILQREQGLADQDGFLSTQLPKDKARLEKLLANALPVVNGPAAGGSMVVRQPSGQPSLVLHVSPVEPDRTANHLDRVAALVLLVEPGILPVVDPRLVASALRLSPAQSRVAVMLAEGKTIGDIVAATRSQENTVRYHLKQVHAKLGISRRAELVRLVLSLARVSSFTS